MLLRSRAIAAYLVFALALLAGAYVREGESAGVTQAIIWLPSGIAISGLWLFGLRAWWIVAAYTLLHRVSFGYGALLVTSAALGSTAEAVFGVLLLRRLGLRPDFARLRDVLTLSVAAVLAPLASILVSWGSRSFLNSFGSMPFRSGWDGWWRMNALGVMSVVPLAACRKNKQRFARLRSGVGGPVAGSQKWPRRAGS